MQDQDEHLELVEERLEVGKREVVRGRVVVRTRVAEHEAVAEALLRRQDARIERVPLNRPVDSAPVLREEGGVVIVPVLEERLVVSRQLVLVEELRITIAENSEPVRETVTLRRERADVVRESSGAPESSGEALMAQERTLTAMYDTRGAAEMARSELVSIGVPESGMSIRSTEASAALATADTSANSGQEKGFWQSLADLFVPDEDRSVYAEGLRRGGYLLSVQVPAGLEDQAIDCLERSEPIDLDERSESWRQGGWTADSSVYTGQSAYAGSTSGSYEGDRSRSDEIADAQERAMRNTYADDRNLSTGEAMRGSFAPGQDTHGTTSPDQVTTSTAPATGSPVTGGRGDLRPHETIPVVEEQVRVGKREVGRGGVRVRSYVVERPVEEQVQLRDEHVTLERRPVDRPLDAGDAAFQERSIEAVERGEEAVVSKTAHVVEEVGLRKDVDTRNETVRDTVRKTEVEVDDDRAATERDRTDLTRGR